jgi:transcriptional antiterminator NusG
MDGDSVEAEVSPPAAVAAEDAGVPEATPATGDSGETAEAKDPQRLWYVIHTYSGYENKVKANLEKRVTSMSMEHQIFTILVPEEEEIELTKDGKRKTVKRKIFPGYVLVEMIFDEASWYVVRNTPGVTGFVSSGNRPTPLGQDEVDAILAQMGVAEEKPRARVEVEVGQNIRVHSGPFDGFIGVIDEIDDARGKVRVLVSMFGRETPLELDFDQIDKL